MKAIQLAAAAAISTPVHFIHNKTKPADEEAIDKAAQKRTRKQLRNRQIESKLSTTDYLLSGSNGEHLRESVKQLREGNLVGGPRGS